MDVDGEVLCAVCQRYFQSFVAVVVAERFQGIPLRFQILPLGLCKVQSGNATSDRSGEKSAESIKGCVNFKKEGSARDEDGSGWSFGFTRSGCSKWGRLGNVHVNGAIFRGFSVFG